MDFYGFYTGTEFEAYNFLGAHRQGNGVVFRTFAPGARKIDVIGEFNSWQGQEMRKIHDGNFWECEAAGRCTNTGSPGRTGVCGTMRTLMASLWSCDLTRLLLCAGMRSSTLGTGPG